MPDSVALHGEESPPAGMTSFYCPACEQYSAVEPWGLSPGAQDVQECAHCGAAWYITFRYARVGADSADSKE